MSSASQGFTLSVTGPAFFVAITGSDTTGNGSFSNPWRTIAKGLLALTPGSTLFLRGGTYTENLTDKIPGGTSEAARVTVAGYPGEMAVVRPTSGSYCCRLNSGRNYVTLKNLILDGSLITSVAIWISASHHNHVIDCTLYNAFTLGAFVDGANSNYNRFVRVKAYDNGVRQRPTNIGLHHGFYITSNYNVVDQCESYGHDGLGIQIYKSGGNNASDCGYNVISNSKFHDNWASGFGIFIGRDNLAYNNLSYRNRRGARNDTGDTGTKYYHNTFWANNSELGGSTGDHYAIGVGVTTPKSNGTIIKNNVFWQNNSGGVNDQGLNTVTSNNLSIDPLFVNQSADDLHLQSGSPMIDMGLTLPEVLADHDGVSRPQGAGYDIGAYERVL